MYACTKALILGIRRILPSFLMSEKPLATRRIALRDDYVSRSGRSLHICATRINFPRASDSFLSASPARLYSLSLSFSFVGEENDSRHKERRITFVCSSLSLSFSPLNPVENKSRYVDLCKPGTKNDYTIELLIKRQLITSWQMFLCAPGTSGCPSHCLD